MSECFQSSEFVEELIRCDTPVEIWSYLKKKISEDNKKQKGD
ncbi:putative transcriptional antiterminator, BglG family [Parageobacillus caldoxylosilyticus]|uniref:Putative transcriptional antiterminator, BglG family n=1 Tax=Saccharococcus caldoxylosilyticus TaxID=81408 RepID=A0A150LV84_9BACL|nr:putative transcriptional antiterminator, BglG family [Parageobacillus caldoxylosilyticus]